MNIIFIEPTFPANQREFVRALKSVGATVIGIGEAHRDSLDDNLKSWLFEYIQVNSVTNVESVTRAVKFVQSRLWVDRLESTIEAHILPIAQVRERCTIPGLSVHTCFLCRDKPAMKEALRNAEVPCAASIGSGNRNEILEFAQKVGYPLIVKPRSGAGASGTSRVDELEALEAALVAAAVGNGGEVAVEEFVEGHEGFYDTITINGHVVLEFVTHYFPNVLDAMRHRWISPQFITTNRIDSTDTYDEVKHLGRRVIQALNIETAATHMEWFFGPKGLRFSEIGCRPPGVRAWDLYNVANDLDLYVEWANAIVHGAVSTRPSRRFSAGVIALRPDRDGLISHYDGLEDIHARFGEFIIDCHLPPENTPTQPIEAGYMANAWIRLKHPDFDHLRYMLDEVGRVVQVRAK
ncbi:MAG TPA: ATP-grasp domain-containing protein [Pirellulaceae bacterium]|nr:ATP-grasp domain-containing protein [Pirellulaceae bacterium]HMO92156.1 ATP-grasp domain-containing protein [Pirellulaceae bacterium]HMP68918.1 ATP-grasp domain-containing protein [Pirellulaceae bacterium]